MIDAPESISRCAVCEYWRSRVAEIERYRHAVLGDLAKIKEALDLHQSHHQ